MSLATEAGLDPGVLQHLGQPLPLARALPGELLALCRGPDYAEQPGEVQAAGGGCCETSA
jgi:hypothetical protein